MSFPLAPVNGQTYRAINGTIYTYNSALGTWKKVAGAASSGIKFTAAAVAPSSPSLCDEWYSTTTEILFTYVTDGVSDYWVDVSSAGAGSGTVTSISITAGTGVSVSGSPVTASGNITVGLASTAVTAGTYSSPTITVDAQGRITAATSGAALLANSAGALINNGTGTLSWAPQSWTTAGRPMNPYTGQSGFNTDLGIFEIYNGTMWLTAGAAGGSAGRNYIFD